MSGRYRLSEVLSVVGLVEEREVWSLLLLASTELHRNIRIYLESGLELSHLPEYVTVTRDSVMLESRGDITLQGAKELHQEQKQEELLQQSRTEEDWQRLGLYTLAKVIISCIHAHSMSTELVMFFRSILAHQDRVPRLPEVLVYLQRKIKVESAARHISSLVNKLQSVHNSRTFCVSESSGPRSGWRSRGTTLSCPSLLPTQPVTRKPVPQPIIEVSTHEDESSIENCLNNNDVFNLVELPGLKVRRAPSPPLYVPSFIKRLERPSTVYTSLLGSTSRAGQVVRLVLLTGHRLEVKVDGSRTKVQDVLSLCLDKVQVDQDQRPLFGLFDRQQQEEGEEYGYLTPECLLSTYLKNGVLVLYLRYLHQPDYYQLPGPLQNLLYLQLRQDVLSRELELEPELVVQLALLAVQSEVPGDHRVDPTHFLPSQCDASTRLNLVKGLGTRLTASSEDARALYCGLLAPVLCLYRFRCRENRGEGSRRMEVSLYPDTFTIAGDSYSYSDIKQLSYTESYLQLLVKSSDQMKRYKVYCPGSRARQIHDIFLAVRRGGEVEPEPSHASRTRRSLGLVRDQIVGSAKKVGKTLRTPKRARSLSMEVKVGGKRRKLSFCSKDKENCKPVAVQKTTVSTVQNTTLKRSNSVQKGRAQKPVRSVATVRGKGGEEERGKERLRVRMGTRMVKGVEGLRPSLEATRRILQTRVERDQLQTGDFTASGHGILVNQCSSLLPGDRILAVNTVSMEQVSLPTFTRILHSFPHSLEILVSRQQ